MRYYVGSTSFMAAGTCVAATAIPDAPLMECADQRRKQPHALTLHNKVHSAQPCLAALAVFSRISRPQQSGRLPRCYRRRRHRSLLRLKPTMRGALRTPGRGVQSQLPHLTPLRTETTG